MSRQRFPPSVPMLRMCGVATCAAARKSARKGSRTRASAAMSVSVAPAPIARPPAGDALTARISATRRSPTRT
ncbi:MAG TPA: hypothetical protein VHF22_08965, partial [Planctomycetota bacterium]|nr:hypothetical protein [Planctomycetota bacterium]